MASATFADLLAAAEDAGIGTYTPAPGRFDLRVHKATGGKTKKGDPKVSLHLEVASGPDAGKKFWTNYNFTAVKKDGTPNSVGLAITFKDLAALGAEADVVAGWDADSPSFSEEVNAAFKGTEFSADVLVSESGGYTNINLRNISRTSANAGPSSSPASDKPW